MWIDALPLSLKGALTSIGSYKKSYTSIARPLALGTNQECYRDYCAFGRFLAPFLDEFEAVGEDLASLEFIWCLEYKLSD